jgi:hypothetical protein
MPRWDHEIKGFKDILHTESTDRLCDFLYGRLNHIVEYERKRQNWDEGVIEDLDNVSDNFRIVGEITKGNLELSDFYPGLDTVVEAFDENLAYLYDIADTKRPDRRFPTDWSAQHGLIWVG